MEPGPRSRPPVPTHELSTTTLMTRRVPREDLWDLARGDFHRYGGHA
jgi:hypothetical protein